GVVFGGGGSNRTVVVTPVPGRQGTAHVTITVTDADGNTADGTFQVTVGVPSLSPLADQVTPMDTPTGPIPFLAEDAEGDVLSLAVSSSNEAVLPSSQIHIGGAGSNRTLTLEPAPGATGLARVDVVASDGFNSVRRSFVLTVFPTRGVLLREPF